MIRKSGPDLPLVSPHFCKTLTTAAVLIGATLSSHAADVIVRPSTGSGFVVKDATGANDRLRVQESGAISLPDIAASPAQAKALCVGTTGQLGLCGGAGTGGNYNAGAGLLLGGTTFSVAPAYQLPQGCAANQIPQWSGTAWNCGSTSGGGTQPTGTVNQTLRYDASNTLVANNFVQAFDGGGLMASGLLNTGSIPDSNSVIPRLAWYPAKAALLVGYNAFLDSSIGNNSISLGHTAVASGNYSLALGSQAKATGNGAAAIGGATTASGANAMALGVGTTAEGNGSTAMGSNSYAAGLDSLATGLGTYATGNYSTAMGRESRATSDYATAMGLETSARGGGSTAMGGHTIASGYWSTAMGFGTEASGDKSTAMGERASTSGKHNSFVYGDASADTMNTSDNQFTVRASGGFIFLTDDKTAAGSGAALAPGSGSWTALSDRNAKTAVRPVNTQEVLEKIVALPLSTWQYKTQDSKYRHMGPMAQDFFASFQLGESDTGIDTVDADGVTLAAIQGLKEEKDREIAELRKLVTKLSADLQSQSRRLAAIEQRADQPVARNVVASRAVAPLTLQP